MSSRVHVAATVLALLQASLAGFVEDLAVEDTWLNQLTDCSFAAVTNWTCGLPCEKVKELPARMIATNEKEKTMALTARKSATECLVVFRGSKNIYNALEDATFFPKALPGCDGCKVHSGFHNAWKTLEVDVNGHLSQLGCQNSTVSVVGHSLGAAMAALAAYDLAAPRSAAALAPAKWRIGRVYTYGQPRVGNRQFASAFDARRAALNFSYYRVVDYRDLVPHLPLADMLWEGWTHTGEEVYYHATALGEFTTCALANDTRCSAQWEVFQTISHTCDHCSCLGMNPCHCGATAPDCHEPHRR